MAYSLHNPNKPSIVTSLSTMLLCIPFATPNVVMNVETKAFWLFVFSLIPTSTGRQKGQRGRFLFPR